MNTTTKTPRPVKAQAGTVRVLRPVGAVNERAGEVRINGRDYYLALRLTCYTLYTFDARRGAVAYDLPADLSSCDCPDHEFRPRPEGCKHRRALAALRGAGKLPDLHPEASYKPGHSSDLPF